MAGETWSTREVDLTIDTYFSMLRLELDGEEYSKAEFRRDLREPDRALRRVGRVQAAEHLCRPDRSRRRLHRRLQARAERAGTAARAGHPEVHRATWTCAGRWRAPRSRCRLPSKWTLGDAVPPAGGSGTRPLRAQPGGRGSSTSTSARREPSARAGRRGGGGEAGASTARRPRESSWPSACGTSRWWTVTVWATTCFPSIRPATSGSSRSRRRGTRATCPSSSPATRSTSRRGARPLLPLPTVRLREAPGRALRAAGSADGNR